MKFIIVKVALCGLSGLLTCTGCYFYFLTMQARSVLNKYCLKCGSFHKFRPACKSLKSSQIPMTLWWQQCWEFLMEFCSHPFPHHCRSSLFSFPGERACPREVHNPSFWLAMIFTRNLGSCLVSLHWVPRMYRWLGLPTKAQLNSVDFGNPGAPRDENFELRGTSHFC